MAARGESSWSKVAGDTARCCCARTALWISRIASRMPSSRSSVREPLPCADESTLEMALRRSSSSSRPALEESSRVRPRSPADSCAPIFSTTSLPSDCNASFIRSVMSALSKSVARPMRSFIDRSRRSTSSEMAVLSALRPCKPAMSSRSMASRCVKWSSSPLMLEAAITAFSILRESAATLSPSSLSSSRSSSRIDWRVACSGSST
mmetsp:Transcript_20092/g.51607  ORF Transcript_20092/g.51607 Transcript_20092/m.51607 type:complete len:207 (-) Transcript_20092:62-682(-)